MKKTMLALARGCALIAILGHFSAKPVMAQVRPALVQNIDEPGRSPYTLTLFCSTEASTNLCSGTSATAVPANKRFVVQYINGLLNITGTFAFGSVYSGSSSYYLDPHSAANFQGTNLYQINMPVAVYIEAGQTPSIQVGSTSGATTQSGTVTLTGYLIDLTE
jgi:hypothetical protein